MTFRETPEEWAARKGKDSPSPEALDGLSSQLHDQFAARYTIPDEVMARVADDLFAKIAKEDGKEIEFIGNWWIEGNPYKGLNCVVLDHEEYMKFEIQLHTPESARLAKANHPDYEISRDWEQPIERRQAAFDRMVARFAKVPHPPGIERIGTPVKVSRPVPEPEPIDPREEILARVTEAVEKLGIGARVEPIEPEYPDKLRYLLESGRTSMSLRHYRTALREFDQLIAEFGDSSELWSKRGVANATVNSGIALERLGKFDEAIDRFDRVIDQAAEDQDVWQEASYAERFKREAIERNEAE